jgi:N-acetylglutamate synthase-like GNAT family acetyltransferase
MPEMPENLCIRLASLNDAVAIDIILSTYFLDRDEMPYEDFFVAELNNKVIGCGVFEKIKAVHSDSGDVFEINKAVRSSNDKDNENVFYEIHTIAVLPPYKNKGYGKRILKRLILEIKNETTPFVSKKIYTRTTAPDFFIHFGFLRGDPALKKQLWEECVACGKYETCAQTLLYKEIGY